MPHTRTRIKMCGTTRLEDARAAVDAGVDALGFIFVRKSPRYISPKQAGDIIDTLPPFIARVGVFVNSSFDEIKSSVNSCGLTHIQLHGDESPDFCLTCRLWNRTISICKAFRVGKESPPTHIGAYCSVTDSVLLDTYSRGLEGGTGLSFDWTVIDSLKIARPLILAGGLNPENVQDAIRNVAPYAIDINSGVERTPGIKDHQKIRKLTALVRDADSGLSRC